MARKTAAQHLADGKGPRQRIWDMIRATKGHDFERLEVIPGDVPNDTARTYLTGLEKGGYIARVGEREGAHPAARVRRYRLERDVGIEAPRVKRDGTPVTQGLAQEQMWRTLRMLKGDINAVELAAYASTPCIVVDPVAADSYLRTLRYASYARLTAKGHGNGRPGSGTLARYQLVTNTGPRPPMICRADALYDPNINATVWIQPVTEEDAIYAR